MTAGAGSEHLEALHAAWADYGDARRIAEVVEVSAEVSTNRVYRVVLENASTLIAKVSSYGSYFLFAEDHDRINATSHLLRGTRWEGMLADTLVKDGRTYTWYDEHIWVVFYEDVPRRRSLPRILTPDQVANLGREMAAFHRACSDIAPRIPLTSHSVKSDAIHLLDLLSSPFAARNFEMPPEQIGIAWRHTHEFLLRLEEVRYDWQKIPVLVDWNLGNFSVDDQPDGSFQLYSRWDYDWFRMEPRTLDFYFCSRVSSRTGDRTEWSYSAHTLTEPRFVRFLDAYHSVFALTEEDIRFLPEAYRFFILNYVIREGARFFRPELARRFRREAVQIYLPRLGQIDLSPLLEVVA